MVRPIFFETLTIVYYENQPQLPNLTVIGGTILLFTGGMVYLVKKYLPKIVRKNI